jgi:signal transduction histidine kinase/CHASE3 domain sensor protein/ActR/RegA family two-component response regulator
MKLSFNNPSITARLFSAFTIMLIVILTVIIISYKNSRKIIDSTDMIIHTHEVLTSLGQVKANLLNLETGQRGFIITGKQKYLKPYTTSLKVVQENIARLRKLTSDNKNQTKRISLLKEMVNSKLDVINKTIQLRQQKNGFEKAKEIVLTDEGMLIMDKIRTQIKEIENEELTLLSIRSSAPEKSRKNSRNILAALLFFSALFTIIISFFTSRSITRPIKALHDGTIIVGHGNLDHKLGINTKDEIGQLSKSFELMLEKLKATMSSKHALEHEIENRKRTEENLLEVKVHLEKSKNQLIATNKELAFQNAEKEKRALELIIANKELAFQNEEKEKRASELIIANKGLAFQNEEKEKRAVELIIAKEQAEKSDRLKSAFLANMSHEIRTPMNGILGFANLLKTPNISGEEQQEFIEIIEESGKRMLNIINDIMSISKIEAGLMSVYSRESNINEQIEYIYTFFKPEAEAKGITLSFKNSLSEKEAIITTDREKLYAILTNLVKNAIKYSEKGSIELGYTKKGKQLEFYVKDTGIGIDKDRQAAIFERFIQADISDEKAFKGAGLGLAISKAYVEMLGGKLWLESEKGIGSTFYFTLPYDSETKEERETVIDISPKELKTPLKKLKTLIVDDDETSRRLLNTILANITTEVLYAENGLEAVEVFRNNLDIDLILIDINMPIMDGYEATRQIRQFDNQIFIIAQAAQALEGDKEKVIKAGCSAYISKPINKQELLALIQKHFKK